MTRESLGQASRRIEREREFDEKRRANLRRGEGQWCRYFNGIQNAKCEAAIAYDSLPRPLPCIRDSKGKPVGVCGFRSFLTPEEIEIKVEQRITFSARFMVAANAAHKHAAANGFKKGNGGAATLACPVCETGTLGYRVSAYNGHMAAKCSTQGCVAWME